MAKESTRRASTMWLVLLVGLVIIAIDQLTKVWAVHRLETGPPIEVVGDVLVFTFTRNPGAAFSIGASSTLIVSLLALAIVVVLLIKARRLQSVWWAIAIGGMVGGALGNLIDRVFRSPGTFRGHVVDFISLPYWPIFNIADMAVVGSAILMVVLSILGVPTSPSEDDSEEKESRDGSVTQGNHE